VAKKKKKEKKKKVMIHKIKKKKAVKEKFYEIEIPQLKTNVNLLAASPENLKARRIKIDLTRTLRGKSFEASLIVKTKGEKVTAEIKKIHLMPFYIKRIMKRGIDYVEDSFSAECKDAVLKIKPFLITRKKVSRTVRKTLRQKARAYIQNYIKDKTSEQIIDEILYGRFQKPMSLKLKKIYPLGFCDIRMLEIESEKEKIEKEKVKKEKTEETPKITEIKEQESTK